MFEAGEIDVYGLGITDPELYRRIQASRVIQYEISYGSSSNCLQPCWADLPQDRRTKSVSRPRNSRGVQLADRPGLRRRGDLRGPRRSEILPLTTAFPDYARLADVARRLELHYSYDPEKAKAVIAKEMVKLGAQLVNEEMAVSGQAGEDHFAHPHGRPAA